MDVQRLKDVLPESVTVEAARLLVKCGTLEVQAGGGTGNDSVTMDGRRIPVQRLAIEIDWTKGGVPVVEMRVIPIRLKEMSQQKADASIHVMFPEAGVDP